MRAAASTRSPAALPRSFEILASWHGLAAIAAAATLRFPPGRRVYPNGFSVVSRCAASFAMLAWADHQEESNLIFHYNIIGCQSTVSLLAIQL
jgi:hypothetical protein